MSLLGPTKKKGSHGNHLPAVKEMSKSLAMKKNMIRVNPFHSCPLIGCDETLNNPTHYRAFYKQILNT